MSDEKVACFTLDLENDWYFDEPGYDHLTLDYLDEFIELIDELDIPLTVFVVGNTLERFPEAVDRLHTELDCEFHLHSYQHDTSKEYDFREEIRQGKRAFRRHFGHDPVGYRAPQGNIEPDEFRILEEEGFQFDSSVFPSYRPGVYNNLSAPLTPYVPEQVSELLEIPIGATEGTRIPTAHSYVKLLGRPYLTYLNRCPLPDPLVYNLHLHDLYRTESHDQISDTKQFIYDRNMERTETMFRKVVEVFNRRGYQAYKMTSLLKNELNATSVGTLRVK